jgi:uncharacterized OB-fold protein
VAERPVAPRFADPVPHILAIVQWDEGPRFSTEIVNAEPDQLTAGMRVRPVFVVSEVKLAAKLEKIRQRLATGASNATDLGNS